MNFGGGTNLSFGAGAGFGGQLGPVGLVAAAVFVGLGVLAVTELHDPSRSQDCCGTGNVPQVIPQDLCLSQLPPSCCPAIT